MLLKLIYHICLEVPDPLVMHINEHSVPRRVQAALMEELLGEPGTPEEFPRRTLMLVEVGEEFPLMLGPIEWRGDFIMRVLREIREAAAEVRIVADDGTVNASIVDVRANR